jgi:hypothetical protein
VIHHGDCIDVMAGMEPESVDAMQRIYDRGRRQGLCDALERISTDIANIAAAMPWQDEAHPDYAEAIAAIRAVILR